MNLRNKSRQSFLASIFIFTFIFLVHAGMTEDGTANVQSASMTDITTSKYSDIDIIGLKLGMTQEQAIAVLKKHNKKIHISLDKFEVLKPDSDDPMVNWRATSQASRLSPEQKLLPNYLKVINASISGVKQESITIMFAEPPANNVVKYIKRINKFDRNAMPSKRIVVDAVTKKYGSPIASGRRLIWSEAGVGKSGVKEECTSAIQVAVKRSGSGPMVNVGSNCGVVLDVEVHSNDKVAHGMNTVLMDYTEINRQKLATENYMEQLKEQIRHEKLKKASQSSAPVL
jgi:hypothetical protein